MIWLFATAQAAITLEGDPTVDQEVVVAVTDAFGEPQSGETVRVRHGPELTVAKEVAVGITDGRGRVRWTPTIEGVAELQVGNERHRLRVAPRSYPAAVALWLGLVALAGSGSTLAGLLRRRPR